MDTAHVSTVITAKRRAQGPVLSEQDLACDGPVDYVGRHARRPASAPRTVIAAHPRAHGFSILSRLARAEHLTAAAV